MSMSLDRLLADDPVGLSGGHRCDCRPGCECKSAVRMSRTWPHEHGRPPAFVLAVLGRFGGCVRGGQVSGMKNLSRVGLSAAGQDAAVSLVEGQAPYTVEVEIQHTEPHLSRGHCNG